MGSCDPSSSAASTGAPADHQTQAPDLRAIVATQTFSCDFAPTRPCGAGNRNPWCPGGIVGGRSWVRASWTLGKQWSLPLHVRARSPTEVEALSSRTCAPCASSTARGPVLAAQLAARTPAASRAACPESEARRDWSGRGGPPKVRRAEQPRRPTHDVSCTPNVACPSRPPTMAAPATPRERRQRRRLEMRQRRCQSASAATAKTERPSCYRARRRTWLRVVRAPSGVAPERSSEKIRRPQPGFEQA